MSILNEYSYIVLFYAGVQNLRMMLGKSKDWLFIQRNSKLDRNRW